VNDRCLPMGTGHLQLLGLVVLSRTRGQTAGMRKHLSTPQERSPGRCGGAGK
jgi:hypothetical protein